MRSSLAKKRVLFLPLCIAIHECQNSQCRSAPENSYPTRVSTKKNQQLFSNVDPHPVRFLFRQVCHHIECQETNGGRPYCLCTDCDELVHRASKSSHVRFNFTPAGKRDVVSHYAKLDFSLMRRRDYSRYVRLFGSRFAADFTSAVEASNSRVSIRDVPQRDETG